MGICQSRHALIFHGEVSEICQHVNHLAANDLQSVTHHDNVCIIADIAGSCTQMNDAGSLGADLTVCIHVGHDIVPAAFFFCFCHVIVNVVDIGFQFVHLLLCHGQTEFHFCPSQSHPKATPCGELLVSGENVLHFLAGIAGAERAFITCGITHLFVPLSFGIH